MATSSTRSRSRKSSETVTTPPVSHADHLLALQAREQGKTVMYKHDAWGHLETRFVRTANVAVWEAKGFHTR